LSESQFTHGNPRGNSPEETRETRNRGRVANHNENEQAKIKSSLAAQTHKLHEPKTQKVTLLTNECPFLVEEVIQGLKGPP